MSIEKTIGHTEPNFEVRMTERLWRSASMVYRHLLTQPAKRWRLETEVKAPVWMRDLTGRLGQNSHRSEMRSDDTFCSSRFTTMGSYQLRISLYISITTHPLNGCGRNLKKKMVIWSFIIWISFIEQKSFFFSI